MARKSRVGEVICTCSAYKFICYTSSHRLYWGSNHDCRYSVPICSTILVEQIGTQKSTVPSAKGRLVVVYKSVVYSHSSGELDGARQYLANLKQQVHMRIIDVGQAISMAYEYGKTGRK